MEKIEINVRGTGYSAYFDSMSDFAKERKSTCPECGQQTKYSPVFKVELKELWNAHKMTPVSLSSPRAREVAKKIKMELNRNRKRCDECFSE